MCESSGLIDEEILHDYQLHGGECIGDMCGVWIRLRDIFALNINTAETTDNCGVEHIGDAHPRGRLQFAPPKRLELLAHGVVRNMTVAGKFMREGTHVAGTLHVILPA